MRAATVILQSLAFSGITVVSGDAPAQPVPGDGHALSAIFAEQHVEQATLDVRRRSAALSPEDRYEFLSDWVLPGDGHTTLRLGLEFLPTNPSPPVTDGYAIDVGEHPAGATVDESRMMTGGYPVSPALDLVDVAARLGRLDELRARIEQSASDDELQQRCRLALLLLTDAARRDFDSARTSLDELSARVRGGALAQFSARWPETLAVWIGIRHPQIREPARELLLTMLQDQVRSGYARGPERWDRAVGALAGRLRHFEMLAAEDRRVGRFAAAPALRNFSPVGRTTALTRGHGFPCTHWISSPGAVEKLAGHNEDYLMFRIPLRGNFEVECDVSTFGWRDSHLSVAGVWVSPNDHLSYAVGGFRSARPLVTVDPRLSQLDEWIRYRVVARQGVCTTYFNGRPVHQERLPEEHDPWLAIRSVWYANTEVRELRITGEPEIPEQIRISALADLTGWTAYYDETVGGVGGDWRQLGDLQNGGGIIGRRQPELAGSHQEHLLRYQRPLLEDGTIEYGFYYSAGNAHVHPALDRRAFLLSPDGVRIHWVTDGIYDRTGLDPANLTVEPQCRRGPDRLPLKQNAWNTLRLTLTGDVVDLFLNEMHVYRCLLEPTNQLTFGLFHYADRTEARVRNIVWTGGWPRELPTVAEQELAGEGMDFLDERLEQLTAVFEHDFAADGLPPALFGIHEVNPDQVLTLTPAGLRVRAPGLKDYVPTFIAPRLRVHGDFDIIAAFEGLETVVPQGGSSGISLRSILDDPNEQRTVYRGFVRNFRPQGRQLMQSIFVRNVRDGPRMTFHDETSEESTSGRLRIARRGETVYCLLAEGDSSQFRLVTGGPFATDSLRSEGVRLTAATQGDSGYTSVVWKTLTIRAEQITDLPAPNESK